MKICRNGSLLRAVCILVSVRGGSLREERCGTFSALLRNRRNTAQLLSVGCNKGHERVPMALNCVILRVLR